MNKFHYFDNAATTQILPEVQQEVARVLSEYWANPSSPYRIGHNAYKVMEMSRATIAWALGCDSNEVIFTGSGSEANNIAILGAAAGWLGDIVCTGYEHASVHNTVLSLWNNGRNVIFVAPSSNGEISANKFLSAITPRTFLVCMMHVNNETGAVLDVEKLAAEIRKISLCAHIHVDGVQAFTKSRIKLSATEIDSYSISGHKIHAPKGIGALYLRRGKNIASVLHGGGQEKGLRPGTENVPYIAGFARAVEIATSPESAKRRERMASLGLEIARKLNRLKGIKNNAPPDPAIGFFNISIIGQRSEAVIQRLASRGVYVSAASACSKGELSHTLQAMGLPEDCIASAVRITLSPYNTEEDASALIAALKEICK